MKITKWVLIVVAGLVVLGIGYRALTVDDMNAKVAADIRANPQGERAARTMLLTLADGRMYPVNFLHEGDKVFMGIDGLWWREFLVVGQPFSLFIQGSEYRGHAVAVLDDPAYTADIFSRLRPTVPKWLPDWLNGKLVVISLES